MKILRHLVLWLTRFAWTPTTERMPPEGVTVLGYMPEHPDGVTAIVYRKDAGKWPDEAVLYWLPLPKPPIGKKAGLGK
jgi:hypothetical protein